jgi:hypothetical protein
MNRWIEIGGRITVLLAEMLTGWVPARAAAATLQPATVLWVNCGGEDERPCSKTEPNMAYNLLPANTPSDNWNNNNDTLRCDSGLQIHSANSTLRCVNRNRMIVGETNATYNPPWTVFARQNQFNSVQADQPITFAPIYGTHNSYSNYFDGAQSQLSTDQGFSITDQLQYGARMIRLDPWLFDNTDFQLKMCHSSTVTINTGWLQKIANFLNVPMGNSVSLDARTLCDVEDPLGNRISQNRSFVFAVKELAHWLRQHPGEVVVLYLHDRAQGWEEVTDLEGLISTDGTGVSMAPVTPQLYYHAALAHELGSVIYQNPTLSAGVQWSKAALPAGFRFPTLRQMRAMGKQVIVLSDYGSDLAFQASDGNGLLQIQDAPDQWTQSLCTGGSGSIIASHTPQTFAESGEDRTLSNPYQNKMMDSPRVRTALHCGFNEIGLDFVGTLAEAPDPALLAQAASPLFGVLVGVTAALTSQNFQCNDFSQGSSCSTTDYRREAGIWSWAPGNGAGGQAVQMTTANGDSFRSWTSAATSGTAPYLCAKQNTVYDSNGAQSDGSYPDSKLWYISHTAGPWQNGETVCQTEQGAGWHFWHPMSAVQQDAAYGTLQTTGKSAVWINHINGPVVALPTQITLQQKGSPVTFVVSGGLGGALTATTDSPNIQVTPVPFYSNLGSNQSNVNNTSNLFKVSMTSAGNALPGGGTYTFHVKIQESGQLTAINPGSAPQVLATGGSTTVTVTVQTPTVSVTPIH